MPTRDIRLDQSFWDNIKILRLKKSAGAEGVLDLLKLWSWAADHKPSGDLSGMPDDEIENAARIAVGMLSALRSACLVDGVEGHRKIHDWQEHQPWVFHAKDRSRLAKAAAEQRWSGPRKPVKRGFYADSNAERNAERNAPSPIPSPSLTPLPPTGEKREQAPSEPKVNGQVNGGDQASPEELAAIRARLGLDDQPTPTARRGLQTVAGEPASQDEAERREVLRRQAEEITGRQPPDDLDRAVARRALRGPHGAKAGPAPHETKAGGDA